MEFALGIPKPYRMLLHIYGVLTMSLRSNIYLFHPQEFRCANNIWSGSQLNWKMITLSKTTVSMMVPVWNWCSQCVEVPSTLAGVGFLNFLHLLISMWKLAETMNSHQGHPSVYSVSFPLNLYLQFLWMTQPWGTWLSIISPTQIERNSWKSCRVIAPWQSSCTTMEISWISSESLIGTQHLPCLALSGDNFIIWSWIWAIAHTHHWYCVKGLQCV